MTFTMHCPAFQDGEQIPEKYTRDGQNVSPPLKWENAPEEAKSFVLVVEDPDAPSGTFHHWGVYNLPGRLTEIWENATKDGLGDRLCEALNDFGNPHYDGPQPPPGHGRHRYYFRLAALDVAHLDVPEKVEVSQLWQAAQPHIIAEAKLMGTYERTSV